MEINMSKTYASSPLTWYVLVEFNLPCQSGAEDLAIDHINTAVQPLNLSAIDLEHLKPDVTKAVIDVVEYGNRYDSNGPILIRVYVFKGAIAGSVADHQKFPSLKVEISDMATNPSNQEATRGWGFFLLERVVNDIQIGQENSHYSIELFLYPE